IGPAKVSPPKFLGGPTGKKAPFGAGGPSGIATRIGPAKVSPPKFLGGPTGKKAPFGAGGPSGIATRIGPAKVSPPKFLGGPTGKAVAAPPVKPVAKRRTTTTQPMPGSMTVKPRGR
ncbi:MAG: hypothetical protein WCP53_09380, partial [Verrucomicrobiota bacterium]